MTRSLLALTLFLMGCGSAPSQTPAVGSPLVSNVCGCEEGYDQACTQAEWAEQQPSQTVTICGLTFALDQCSVKNAKGDEVKVGEYLADNCAYSVTVNGITQSEPDTGGW